MSAGIYKALELSTVVQTFNPSTKESRQVDYYELEAGLLYIAKSRLARAIW